VLPRGFVRIRHFGYLASAHRTALLALAPPSARLPTSARYLHRQLPVSHLALPTLRSQHAHRPQPYRATTGLPMQTLRLFLIPPPSHHSQTCAGTSSPNCALTATARPHRAFLPACRSRNYPFHRPLPRTAPSHAARFRTIPWAPQGPISPPAP
jgi:hypothetical protein